MTRVEAAVGTALAVLLLGAAGGGLAWALDRWDTVMWVYFGGYATSTYQWLRA